MASKTRLVRREAEIFAVGSWTDSAGKAVRVVTEDLQQIVDNFYKLKDVHRPPLKLGHSTNQLLQGQEDGDPALGWVEELRVSDDGRKLLATLEVPAPINELIEARLYEAVSIELLFGVEVDGEELGTVLRAVALLGADLPAVSDIAGLRKIAARAGHQMGTLSGTRCAFRATLGGEPAPARARKDARTNRHEESDMELETMVRELAQLVKDMGVKMNSSDAMVRDAEAKRAAAETELKEFRAKAAQGLETERTAAYQTQREQVLGKLDEKVKAGLITPDLRKKFAAELDAQIVGFKAGGALAFSVGLMLELAALASAKLPTGEQGEAVKGGASAGDELATKIAELRVKDQALSPAAAFQQALTLYPELARRYQAENYPEEGAAA